MSLGLPIWKGGMTLTELIASDPKLQAGTIDAWNRNADRILAGYADKPRHRVGWHNGKKNPHTVPSLIPAPIVRLKPSPDSDL